jgi:hypothetical protein
MTDPEAKNFALDRLRQTVFFRAYFQNYKAVPLFTFRSGGGVYCQWRIMREEETWHDPTPNYTVMTTKTEIVSFTTTNRGFLYQRSYHVDTPIQRILVHGAKDLSLISGAI